jgi:subtilisin family serine protease
MGSDERDEYEEGYRDGGSNERFDWWNTLNEEFDWDVHSIKETVEMIKKVMAQTPTPWIPTFEAGDRVLFSGGMGDFDTGTVVAHVNGSYLVDVDENPGDSNSGTYKMYWNPRYIQALTEVD